MPTQQEPTTYKNAHGHNFRETCAFDPSKNKKRKCTFCGCWATKDAACYQCHRTADGEIVALPPQHRTSKSVSKSKMNHEEHMQADEGLVGGVISPHDKDRATDGATTNEIVYDPAYCEEHTERDEIFEKVDNGGSHARNEHAAGTLPKGAVKRIKDQSTVSVPDNANQHQFRKTSAYDPKAKLRMKCPSCGCWVTKGKTCSLCKRVTT